MYLSYSSDQTANADGLQPFVSYMSLTAMFCLVFPAFPAKLFVLQLEHQPCGVTRLQTVMILTPYKAFVGICDQQFFFKSSFYIGYCTFKPTQFCHQFMTTVFIKLHSVALKLGLKKCVLLSESVSEENCLISAQLFEVLFL